MSFRFEFGPRPLCLHHAYLHLVVKMAMKTTAELSKKQLVQAGATLGVTLSDSPSNLKPDLVNKVVAALAARPDCLVCPDGTCDPQTHPWDVDSLAPPGTSTSRVTDAMDNIVDTTPTLPVTATASLSTSGSVANVINSLSS